MPLAATTAQDFRGWPYRPFDFGSASRTEGTDHCVPVNVALEYLNRTAYVQRPVDIPHV